MSEKATNLTMKPCVCNNDLCTIRKATFQLSFDVLTVVEIDAEKEALHGFQSYMYMGKIVHVRALHRSATSKNRRACICLCTCRLPATCILFILIHVTLKIV